MQVQLLVWIFMMRIVMVVASGLSYFINEAIAKGKYGNADEDELRGAAHLPGVAHLDRVGGADLHRRRTLLIPNLGGGTRCGGSSRQSSRAARSPAPSSPSSSRCSRRPSRSTCMRS
ncbi:MAG: hypothetical protein QM736_29120 [Vicinamibacterales bacterium]